MKPKNPKPEPDPPVDAESLRQTMIDAFAALQLAQLKHEQAMGIAADASSLSDDGTTSILQSGREYANALTRYTEAAMAWLAFADLHLNDARKYERKAGTGG
jgi:hypothetical protein